MLDETTTQAGLPETLWTPPKIHPLPEDAGPLRRMRAALDNAVSNLPAEVYHAGVVRRRRGGRLVAYLGDPDAVEEMLVRRWRDFPKTPIERRVLGPALGAGLLTSHGEDWRWKRRLAAPAFSPANLSAMTDALIGPFEDLARPWGEPRIADVDALCVAATLRVIERLLFSSAAELDVGRIAEATEAMLAPTAWMALGAMLRAPEWLPYPGQRGQRRAIEEARGLVGAATRRRRAALAAGEPAPRDLATALIEARDPETGRPLSDDDMIDMMLTFVLAGHETSAHTLAWALFCLAHQPALQDVLAREAQAAAESGALRKGDLGALPRIEAAVKETLRLFPVAPLMGRATTRPERFGAVVLPKGALCIAPIYALHRHHRYWGRPDAFDISRWLDRAAPARTLYMPFGAGPRICIGAQLAMRETTLGLAALLRELRVAPCGETVCDPVLRVTLRPRGGLRLLLSRRAVC